jgi:uncharacterized lipoprotein YddW (UPF0748 family)
LILWNLFDICIFEFDNLILVMKIKIIYFLILFSCIVQFSMRSQTSPEKELRGVWVTTAFNIDWPSSSRLSSDEQKAEFINLLDAHKKNGINAIFLQIRPAAEVFYKSEYEPWSHWLTGTQGMEPYPYYDPLEFMIEECHKRNIEFHGWINPFRAVSNIERVKVVPTHITKEKPEWFVTYGQDVRKKYFNPGIPEARAYIIKMILDVVRRYDVDGIHFDDYFYPVKEGGVEFPDNQAFNAYNPNGLGKANWRRENLDDFIKTLHDSIFSIKPKVKFGVGPSGVWRNKSHDPEGSNTRGLSSYDEQYADTRKWLREGWIDYIAPQIYWTIGYKIADYQELVDWWSRNVYEKHLYIGQASHRINETRDWKNPSAIPDQIRLNRMYPQVKGSIFYSSSALLQNKNGILDSLRSDFYLAYADVPDMPWKPKASEHIKPDTTVKYFKKIIRLPEPMAPVYFTATKVDREVLLKWEMDESQKNFLADTGSYYCVYRYKGKYAGYPSEENLYKTTKEQFIMISSKGMFRKKYSFIVTAVNSQKKEGLYSNSLIIKMKD